MRLKVLGCSGGIGPRRHTTSFLIDDDILLDAGTGVGNLSLEDMPKIRHIFLTHSHLDHTGFIPFLVDNVFGEIKEPIIVHGLPETIDALQKHLFNWVIWPDFSKLPSADRPVLKYEAMRPGEVVVIKGRKFEMIPVNHTVPAVAYRVEGSKGVFAFSGDSTSNVTFWETLNSLKRLDLLIVEAAFSDENLELSRLSKHYSPTLLIEDIKKLQHTPEIWITHNKPGVEETILKQLRAGLGGMKIKRLKGKEVFQF